MKFDRGSKALSPLAALANMPVITGSAIQPALSDRKKYPNFWRTVTPITTFAPMFVIMVSWGWKEAGVVWGLTANFQGIWDDSKIQASGLNLKMQVEFSAPGNLDGQSMVTLTLL